MTTNQKQFAFSVMLARLILFAHECGILLSLREVWRSKDRQRQLVAYGSSRTLNSKHLLALASDFVMVRDGKVVEFDDPDWTLLGEYWEGLGGEWGGRWKTPHDLGHFQYKD